MPNPPPGISSENFSAALSRFEGAIGAQWVFQTVSDMAGSAPILSGSVVVDLKRMNRVLSVDEGRCSCVVEPGVSYFDLYEYIQERDLKVWIDTPDPGRGSLVGNALDHGVGHTDDLAILSYSNTGI